MGSVHKMWETTKPLREIARFDRTICNKIVTVNDFCTDKNARVLNLNDYSSNQ